MPKLVGRKNNEENKQRLQINDFPLLTSDFFVNGVPKDEQIKNWLKDYITEGLKSNKIAEKTLLPLKAKLAYYFGVGEGTVQSAVRKLEDEGYVVSKQRIGTIILATKTTTPKCMQKLTSKRDKIVEQIKLYINKNNYILGDILPSMREFEQILNSKRNTIRSALEFLSLQGYIKVLETEKEENKLWELTKEVSVENLELSQDNDIHAETLAQKISANIEKYIMQNCKIGSRLDAINIWAKKYNVSEKTVYDAMQILYDKGIIQSRRGKYGTIVIKMPEDIFQPSKERSIFLPAAEAAIYSYKRIENLLKNKIINEYSVGERLPSMKELSQTLDVSTNTIRRAIMDLSNEGYLAVSRGKFGGIYVLDIPQEGAQTFRWLAVNPQFVKSYK